MAPTTCGCIHLYDGSDNLWVNQIKTHLDCDWCERLRQLKIVRRLRTHVDGHKGGNWRFVTMSSANEYNLAAAFEKDAKAWNALAKGKWNGEWNQVVTYVGWREITWTRKKGYNLHRHLLVKTEKKYWDWAEMHKRWDTANGGQKSNFHESEMRYGMDAMINYASKYCVKNSKNFYWGGLSLRKVRLVADTLFGKRRFLTMRDTKPAVITSGWCYCCSPQMERFGLDGRGTCAREEIMGSIQ